MNLPTVRAFIAAIARLDVAVPVEITDLIEQTDRLSNASSHIHREAVAAVHQDPIRALIEAKNPATAALRIAVAAREHEQANADRQRAADLLHAAQHDIAIYLPAAVVGSGFAETVVRDELRPRLHTLLEDAELLLAEYPSIADGPAALLSDTQDARDAYETMAALAEQYDALRSIQTRAGRLTTDDFGKAHEAFAEFHNIAELVVTEQHWADLPQHGLDPHPSQDRRERLIWIVAGPAVPWMPTVQEAIARRVEVLAQEQESYLGERPYLAEQPGIRRRLAPSELYEQTTESAA